MWPPSAATVSPPSAAPHRSQSSRRRIARRSSTPHCPAQLAAASRPSMRCREALFLRDNWAWTALRVTVRLADRVTRYSPAGGPRYALQPGWRAALR
eukprot:6534452-Prymnesium_polylepis.1